MEGLGRRRATGDLLDHVVLDDAMRIRGVLVRNFVPQRNVQAWCLKTKCLEEERVTPVHSGLSLEGLNELTPNALVPVGGLDPQ